MNNTNNTGEFLKSLRVAKGLTQMELAEYLNVSNKTVSKWESEIGISEVQTLLILPDYYLVTVDDILRGRKKVYKDIEREKNIFNYIVEKSKGKYNNLFIIFAWVLAFK